jgi:hypothetical protein
MYGIVMDKEHIEFFKANPDCLSESDVVWKPPYELSPARQEWQSLLSKLNYAKFLTTFETKVFDVWIKKGWSNNRIRKALRINGQLLSKMKHRIKNKIVKEIKNV